MPKSSRILATMTLILALLVALGGCSRVSLVYNSGDFLLKRYLSDYLELEDAQVERWEPLLEAALARHRGEELPYLAAWFDALLSASRDGFDPRHRACLIDGARTVYQRQARFAVDLSAPLLAQLTDAQVDALERRFQKEAEEDRTDPDTHDRAREARRRAERYTEAAAYWTGPLSEAQAAIIAEVTRRMPDAQPDFDAYRDGKRRALVRLLRQGGDEDQIHRFLTDWLVDFSDLPPALRDVGDRYGERIGELLERLWDGLDAQQRARLQSRLRALRQDLLELQRDPRLAPGLC